MKIFLKTLIVIQAIAFTACSQQVEQAKVPDSKGIIIHNYQQCIKSGGIMLKTYPPRCRSKDGQTFVKEIEQSKDVCKDLCGDDFCQEIVCMGDLCPCPEDKETCPNDCKKEILLRK